MLLGPVKLYGTHKAKNVENGWQFSKVYPKHDTSGSPNEEYWEWATKGWADQWGHRYPMGKGAIPLYSYWDGSKLDYIEARKRIYLPLYLQAVQRSKAYQRLVALYREHRQICLWDYDGYDYHKLGMTLKDVLNDPTKKMGHAFVLAMLLERIK